jgi:DNA-binding MarR family transcriptional regulator
MNSTRETCAREILETVPAAMRFIRNQVRQNGKGVTLPQFRTLAFVSRARDASLSAAAEHLGLSSPAMSRLVDGLVRTGLVVRRTVSTNRRKVALTLTAKGREMLESVRTDIRGEIAGTLGGLSAAELNTISRAMALLHATFGTNAKTDGESIKGNAHGDS